MFFCLILNNLHSNFAKKNLRRAGAASRTELVFMSMVECNILSTGLNNLMNVFFINFDEFHDFACFLLACTCLFTRFYINISMVLCHFLFDVTCFDISLYDLQDFFI